MDCLACEDETLYRLTTNQASSNTCVTAAECDDITISAFGDRICNNLRETTPTPTTASVGLLIVLSCMMVVNVSLHLLQGGGASSIHYHQFLLSLLLLVHSLYL